MGTKTKIQWADHSQNFWRGCSGKVSPGCDHCYMHSDRFIKHPFTPTRTSESTRRNHLKKSRETSDYHWRPGDKVFVNSQSDFFDETVSNDWRREALGVMAQREDLIWIILTKRARKMAEFVGNLAWWNENIWLGVTAENQACADERIPTLLGSNEYGGMSVKPIVRFVSAEPMLGAVDLGDYIEALDWVIIGGESGRKRRTIDFKYAQDLIDQCRAAGVPVFLKQWDYLDGKGLQKAPFKDNMNYMEYPGEEVESRESRVESRKLRVESRESQGKKYEG